MCHRRSDAIGEQADSRSYGVAHAAEDIEALGLGAMRGRGVLQLPAKLQAAVRRDRAARVADGDDDVPALTYFVDGFAVLSGDVDPKLTHDQDGERMYAARARTCALDVETVTGERAQKTFGHLGAGRVVGTEE